MKTKYIGDDGKRMTADQKIEELAKKLSEARDVIVAETKLGLNHPVMNRTAYRIDEQSSLSHQ